MNTIKPAKIFESIMVWLLSLCLITDLLLVFKVSDLLYKFKGVITNQTDFVTLVLNLASKVDDLKSIELFGLINRTFLLILLVCFISFIVYRIVRGQYNRLLQVSTIMIWISSITTVYFVYLTKDVFLALKSITSEKYKEGFEAQMYLLGRIQGVLTVKEIIVVIYIVIIIATFMAIVLNVRALMNKDDEVVWKKLNLSVFFVSLILVGSLGAWNFYLNYEAKQFRPLDYLVLNYTHKNDDVYLLGSVNMRKVNSDNIDVAFRNLYLTGVNYEIENADKPLKNSDIKKINVSYDLETKELLGLKTGDIETKVEINKVPKIVKDLSEINILSLYKYLAKYDSRYFNKSKQNDDIVGVYEGNTSDSNKEYYIIQKLYPNQLSYTEFSQNSDAEFVYKLIYIGVMYQNSGNIVGLEGLNKYNAVAIYNNKDQLLKDLKTNNISKVK